ncbi:DUF309 domain-containing protein [Bacteriovorax sp. DB6_IX]|uniref:DUF309 domain-containing protein n=1 Tax=Bacteriovorax sp. DB6_IX TaxID=1353530 RepID=UPI0012FC8EFD|nr:DUF309 domain-containing protein [Bacteriovorax sp. DB6_IX]
MSATGEPECPILHSESFHTHDDYLYAIDLINYEYFWEAHAYLEAIWNASGRTTQEAVLCKSLIKIAAAGVKLRMNQLEPAKNHYIRCIELVEDLEKIVCGVTVEVVKKDLSVAISHMFSKSSEGLPKIVIELGL